MAHFLKMAVTILNGFISLEISKTGKMPEKHPHQTLYTLSPIFHQIHINLSVSKPTCFPAPLSQSLLSTPPLQTSPSPASLATQPAPPEDASASPQPQQTVANALGSQVLWPRWSKLRNVSSLQNLQQQE